MRLLKLLLLTIVSVTTLFAFVPTANARPLSNGSVYYASIPITNGARTVIAQGRCNWLRPYLASAGLPVGPFIAIAARESGCARNGVRVNNKTDLSTSRFGINFRTPTLRAGWKRWCGATDWRQLGANPKLDVKCAKAAFVRLGYKPWWYVG